MVQNSAQKEKSVSDLKLVYLIHGKEQLLLKEAIDRLKSSFAKEGDLNFNYDQFFGDEDSAQDIIQAAQTLPFISSKRLVLVKKVEKMASSDIKILAEYLNNPSESSCLVLVAEEIKKSSSLYKAAGKHGQIFEYKLPSKKEYPKWIKKRFREKGKLVDDKASRYLVESVGYDLSKLENEIEKISLYYADAAQIGEREISPLVYESSQKNIFDLVDSIGRRDKDSAFVFLKHLLEENNDPPQIIFFMIVRQFRLLIKAKCLLDRGLKDQAVSKALKVPFFVARKLREQCRNFSLEKLRGISGLLSQTDVALKTSSKKPGLLLEGLLVKIMN